MPISPTPHPSGPTGDRGETGGPTSVGVVVLAGGGSRRWGGTDKTAARLGSRPVLAHVVRGVRRALGPHVPVVVVAPAGHPAAAEVDVVGGRGVRWTREDPPGGGPVAGLAVGVAALPSDVTVVAVTAGDVPFGGPALRRLVDALATDAARPGQDADGALGVDPQGRSQPLLAAYRTAPLRLVLDARPVAGRAVRDLVESMQLLRTPVGTLESLDLDTPGDLAAAAAFVEG